MALLGGDAVEIVWQRELAILAVDFNVSRRPRKFHRWPTSFLEDSPLPLALNDRMRYMGETNWLLWWPSLQRRRISVIFMLCVHCPWLCGLFDEPANSEVSRQIFATCKQNFRSESQSSQRFPPFSPIFLPNLLPAIFANFSPKFTSHHFWIWTPDADDRSRRCGGTIGDGGHPMILFRAEPSVHIICTVSGIYLLASMRLSQLFTAHVILFISSRGVDDACAFVYFQFAPPMTCRCGGGRKIQYGAQQNSLQRGNGNAFRIVRTSLSSSMKQGDDDANNNFLMEELPLNQIFQKAVVLQRSGERSGALEEYKKFLKVTESHDVDPTLYVSFRVWVQIMTNNVPCLIFTIKFDNILLTIPSCPWIISHQNTLRKNKSLSLSLSLGGGTCEHGCNLCNARERIRNNNRRQNTTSFTSKRIFPNGC